MQQQKITNNRVIEILIWFLPLSLYLISSQFSSINTDGVRDYIAAFDIAYNQNTPLVGPQMAFTFHIAPWWFYLSSLPMLLTKSWAFQALFVSCLNALKFYLAYQVGKKMLNKELGIILVACLMLSSFTLLQQWSFTHTNLVEVSILLVLYCSLQFNSDKTLSYALLGILTGIALHAHPTAGIVGYWVLLKVLQSNRILLNGIVYLAAIIVVFSPILWHQFSANYVDIKATSAYFHQYTGNYEFIAFFKMIYGVILHAPYMLYKTLLPKVFADILFAFHALFLAFIFINGTLLLIQSKLNRNLVFKLIGFVCFTALFLFFIRHKTPWYMTYSFTVSFALLLSALIYVNNAKYQFKYFPYIFYSISFFMMLIMIISLMLKQNSSIRLPEVSMHNIRTLNTKLGNKGFEFPAYLAKEHGKMTCKHKPVTLNGPYAALIYTHSGIEHLAECGKGGLYYGYAAKMNNLFALPYFFKNLISIQPIEQIGNSYFYHTKNIYLGNKLIEEQYVSDYDRSIKRIAGWQSVHKTATLQKGKYLVISKQTGFHLNLNIHKVTANAERLTPIAQYAYASLYNCQTCNSSDTKWQIQYSESVAGMTNIVSF